MQGPVIRESETSFEHHFNLDLLQVSTDGSEDTAQEGEEICLIEISDTEEVEENQSDNDGKENVDIGLSKGTIDGILDSLDKDITGIETASTSQKTSHVHVEMSKKLPRTSTAIKQRDVNTKKAEKECVLTDWIKKPLLGGGGAHVLGLNQSGIMRNSSAIERRLAKNRLVTVTGGMYKLKGQMDTLLAIQQGLPQKIIAKFKNGFPKEWQELLQEVMTEKHTFPKAEPSFPDKKGSLRKPSQSRSSKKEASSVERTGNQNSSERKLPRSTIPDPDKPQNVVLTPNGDFFDLTNLQRSRSGRLVKPPVYWWVGQRICQGEEGYFVKSNTEYADKYCQEIADQFWSAGKKTTYLKRMKALKDRDNSISSEASIAKKKTITTKTKRTKVTALTANKGTLKRRQQFSAILNQHNENHSDDLFDSAPFRNTRKGKLSRAEMFEGDDLLGEPSKQNGKSRFETPKGEIDLNEFEKRENVDGYLQRGLHNKGKKKRMVTPKPVKQVKVPEDSPHQKLFREYLEAEQSKSENHMDSDQEQDYYWDQDESTTT